VGGGATIKKANVIAAVGGGLRVDNGNVEFGYNGMAQSDISIETQGASYNSYINNFKNQAWRYCLSTNGGDAVLVTEGNVNIYGGTYTAVNGNGIWVRGNNNTTVNVSGGNYFGMYKDNPNHGNNSGGGEWHYGVYSHCGLKITRGGSANVSGGYFEGANGGLIMCGINGTPVRATVIGSGVSSTNNSTSFIGTNDGITIYDYSTLQLGTQDSDSNGPYVRGNGGAALCVNSTSNSNNTSTMTIYDEQCKTYTKWCINHGNVYSCGHIVLA